MGLGLIRNPFRKVTIDLVPLAAEHSPQYAWRNYQLWYAIFKYWTAVFLVTSFCQLAFFIGALLGQWKHLPWEGSLSATCVLGAGLMIQVFCRSNMRYWRLIWQVSLQIEENARAQMVALFDVSEEDSQ